MIYKGFPGKKVLYKDSAEGVDGLDPKDTIYGVYNTGETQVYNITKGDLQDGDSANSKIKFGDTEYTASAASITTYTNFVSNGTENVNAFDKGDGANKYAVASNDAIKFVCDASGDITTAYVTTSAFGKIASITSDKIAIEGLGTKELKDCEVYADAKVGDLVRYVENYSTAKRVNVIEKAETVSGTISAYKASDNQVQIDGNWYKFGANKTVATDYTNAALAASNVGDEVVLIVDGGYYLAYDIISGYDDYAIVTKGNEEFGDQRVKLLMADGTDTIVIADELVGGTALPGTTNAADGKLMAYNLKSEKTKVDLNETSVKTSSSNTKFTSDNKTMDQGVGVLANDATIFLYSTTDAKWKVFKANQLSDFTTSGAVSYIVKDGKAVAVAGKVTNFPTAGSDSVSYGYVTDRVVTKINDDDAVQLTIWNGSSDITLNIDGTTCNAYVGDFIKFPVVADGALVSNNDLKIDNGGFTGSMGSAVVKVKTVESGRIITTTDTVDADNSVVPGTDSVYVVNSDTMYIGVKSEDNTSSTSNTVVPYTKAAGEDFANAYVIYEINSGVNTIKAIFIDEDNKMITYNNGTAQAATGIETIYDITPVSVDTATNGLTATVEVDKTKALAGQTVTVTVTVSGTAEAGSKYINVSGVTATALTMGTLTNASANGTTGVNITAAAETAGTFTYTFTVSGDASPTVSIQA